MGTPVLILALAVAATFLVALVARHAARSMPSTFDVSPVSDYWLSQRKRVREESIH
jgi:hypothetical protein